MASKENQEALDYLYDCCEYGLKVTGKVDGEKETLQKAIDDLELYKKALDKACEFIEGGNELIETNMPIKEIFLKESDKQL